MGSIPLPALQAGQGQQQPQQSALGQYAQLLQIKQALANQPLQQQALQQQVQGGALENQQRQIQLEQAQQGQQDQTAFRSAMQDPSLQGKTISDIADHLASKGQISQQSWQAAKKADLEQRQSLATLDKDQLANAAAGHTQTQQLYNNVMDMPDDQLAQNWPAIAQQYDAIPGNSKMPLNPQQPLTKQQLQQFGPMISMQKSYLDDAQENLKKKADLSKTQADADRTNAETNYYKANGGAPGVSAETVSLNSFLKAHPGKTAADFAGFKAGSEAAARQPYEMALAAQKQALSQGDPKAAAQLLVNGDATLSELKARGATPEFIAKTLFAAHQQSNGAYNAQAADANFQVAKSPANVAFFGSAKSLTDKGGTLDQLAAAAKNLPSNQIPVFNTIADAEKAATGNGPLAKYASLLVGTADDYAKVMGNGTGSDASRTQALHLIPTNASPEARAGAIEGIRGAVGSQINSRIGNNTVMKRMYGDAPAQSAPSAKMPAGATHIVPGPDGKNHYTNNAGTVDLGVAP